MMRRAGAFANMRLTLIAVDKDAISNLDRLYILFCFCNVIAKELFADTYWPTRLLNS